MPSMAIQSKGVLIIMPSLFTEDTYEQAIIELFENMGYDHLYAPDMDRDYSKTTLPSMTQFDYCNMRTPLSSRKEQDIIVSYIEDKCVAIDTAIEKKKRNRKRKKQR